MRTPQFWRKASLLAYLCLPLACIYRVFITVKQTITPIHTSKVPIISIGNLTAGGAGKTPVAMALGQYLLRQGVKVAFLTKGYKGTLKGPVIVNHKTHHYQEVGDEALLLAKIAPTIMAKSRIKGTALAQDMGADVIIMDDGLQHFALKKQLSFAVIDGKVGIGNGFLLPAGPLRQTIKSAEKNIDAYILIEGETLPFVAGDIPIIHARLTPKKQDVSIAGNLIAFTGIAYPEKFFTTLNQLSANVIKTIPFPDHHPYSDKDVTHLLKDAIEQNATLITTEKDALRLPLDVRTNILTLPIKIDFAKDPILHSLLEPFIEAANAPSL